MRKHAAWLLGIGLVGIGTVLGGAALLAESSLRDQPERSQPAQERPETPPRREIPALPPAKPVVGEIRFGTTEVPARTPGAFRMATYNVENLFDEHDDPALSGDQDDLPMTKPIEHREALAAAIRAINADVIALQEVESHDALIWFRNLYLSDMGYEHVASIDAGDSRGIENSVLSRYPLSNARVWPGAPLGGVHPATYGTRGQPNWFAGEPLEFRRSPLAVDLTIPSGTEIGGVAIDAPFEMTLFVVHHKSGSGSGYWREAEATKIVALMGEVASVSPGRPIAVLGDFNSVPTDKVLEIYREKGMIDTLAGRSTTDPDRAKHITHASERTIDFVLVNQALAAKIVPGSPFVFGTIVLPRGADYRSVDPPAGYASDHFPVVVDVFAGGSGTPDKGEEGVKVRAPE